MKAGGLDVQSLSQDCIAGLERRLTVKSTCIGPVFKSQYQWFTTNYNFCSRRSDTFIWPPHIRARALARKRARAYTHTQSMCTVHTHKGKKNRQKDGERKKQGLEIISFLFLPKRVFSSFMCLILISFTSLHSCLRPHPHTHSRTST